MRSIKRERDNVVAAAEVDLGVSARTDHYILLAANHVGGRRRIDARTGAEVPQFLAVGRIVGRELAIALTRENKTARGGENASDHRLRRLDLPFDLAGVVVNGGNFARTGLPPQPPQSAPHPHTSIPGMRERDLLWPS